MFGTEQPFGGRVLVPGRRLLRRKSVRYPASVASARRYFVAHSATYPETYAETYVCALDVLLSFFLARFSESFVLRYRRCNYLPSPHLVLCFLFLSLSKFGCPVPSHLSNFASLYSLALFDSNQSNSTNEPTINKY